MLNYCISLVLPHGLCPAFQLGIWISANSVKNINTAKSLHKSRKQFASRRKRSPTLDTVIHLIFFDLFYCVYIQAYLPISLSVKLCVYRKAERNIWWIEWKKFLWCFKITKIMIHFVNAIFLFRYDIDMFLRV